MAQPVIQQLSRSISAGYDKDSQELIIAFGNGQQYYFEGVPPDVWDGLVKSESPGRYYNARIRGVY